MPRIYRANDFILSDEVYTIDEDDLFEEDPIYDEASHEEGEEEEEGREAVKSPEEEERERREAELAEQVEQILAEARDQARQELAQAREQIAAEQLEARDQAAALAEQMKEQGYNDGFQAGLVEGARQEAEEIRQCINGLETGVGQIEGELGGFMAEYEYSLKWLAWEIASKVLGKKLEENETELVSLVKTAVASVKNAQWITVEVSEKMTGLIDQLNQEFRKMGDERVDIRGITAPDGACIVDTPDGLIDASVYTQLENLRTYFAQEDEEES